ncbi:unnamed protein product [Choristocarpus tenellus]
MMQSREERERLAAARINAGHKNRKNLVADFNTPIHTEGCMRRENISGKQNKSFVPEYNSDSLHVGTVASKANSIDAYIFWTEMEKSRQEISASDTPATA